MFQNPFRSGGPTRQKPRKFQLLRIQVSPTVLLLAVAAFLLVTGNVQFFRHTLAIYGIAQNWPFLISMTLVLLCALMLFATIFSLILPVRIVAAFFLVTASVVGYFTDNLGIIVDTDMIRNMVATEPGEAFDLITWGLVLRVIGFGILPSVLVFLVPLKPARLLVREGKLAATVIGTLLVTVLLMAAFTDTYASYFREHKQLRYYTNPTLPIYSVIKLAIDSSSGVVDNSFKPRTATASTPAGDSSHELVVVVLGETARSDHFGINGYERQTTPKLAARKDIVSFSNMHSCGTATAISLPCMFSLDGRDSFDINQAARTENILDVLVKAGVSVLWRDNNTGSHGVADRIPFERFTGADLNPVCDEVECRDLGMLDGLDEYIAAQDGDILIVLHQMGSHGPAYFKRYPQEFARFIPDCRSNELGTCSDEEIVNAYDNSILYTDSFLNTVITYLEGKQDSYETAMIYLSDHGESLGEMGIYLHGLPYFVAPAAQTHVPFIIWAGESSDIDMDRLRPKADMPLTHDDLSRLMVELFEMTVDDREIADSSRLLPKKPEGYNR